MTVTKHVGTVSMRVPRQYSGKFECSWFSQGDLKYVTFLQDALELDQ